MDHDVFAEKVYNPKLHRQEVFFDKHYNTILNLHSYGHDIETAWLIDRGCKVLDDPELTQKMYAITRDLTAQIYKVAFDGHSLANECDRGVVNVHRVWWVQAETVIGFLNGYEKEPEKTEYLEAAEKEWAFIRDHVIDKRPGSEWFWEVDPEGNPYPDRPIVEPWKCPYHNGRMCMEVRRDVRALLHRKEKQEKLLSRKNVKSDFYNGIYDRYEYPVLTREHIPLTWRYDLNPKSNP